MYIIGNIIYVFNISCKKRMVVIGKYSSIIGYVICCNKTRKYGNIMIPSPNNDETRSQISFGLLPYHFTRVSKGWLTKVRSPACGCYTWRPVSTKLNMSTGWWLKNHLEKYESMGRMTSHI